MYSLDSTVLDVKHPDGFTDSVLFRFNTEYNPVQWYADKVSLERVKNMAGSKDLG